MAWYDFLRSRPAPLSEPPIVDNFIIDIKRKLETNEPFSIVHILIDEGKVDEIHNLLGGKRT